MKAIVTNHVFQTAILLFTSYLVVLVVMAIIFK